MVIPGRNLTEPFEMNRILGTGLLPCLIIVFVSCSAEITTDTQHTFTISDENGIQLARTEGGPKYEGELFEYTEVVRLQQDDSIPESLLNRPYYFSMGVDGTFFLLDGGENRILVFNQDGSYRRSIGGPGDGPGEFQSPRYLTFYENVLSLYDGRLRRTSHYHPDGAFLKSNSFLQTPPRTRTLEMGPNGEYICFHDISPEGRESQIHEAIGVMIFSADGDTIGSMNTPVVHTASRIPMDNSGTALIASKLFNGRPQALYHPGSGILISSGKEPWMEWYNLSGRLTRRIEIDIPRMPVSPEERRLLNERLETDLVNATDDLEKSMAKIARDALKIPDDKDHWSTILVDEFAYIWAMIPTNQFGIMGEIYHYRVLSPEGEYLGDTAWPKESWALSRGHILVIEDYSDRMIPVIYRITSKVDGFRFPSR